MVEAVVFDIGNVLIEWQPERHYDSLMPRPRREAMFAEVDLHAMNDAIDTGAPFYQTVAATAARYPQWQAEIMRWHDDWLKMASPVIPHSLRLMKALQARGVPVFALSNFGIGTFELACLHYPFLRDFDQPYISGYMGVTKPGPRIYELLEEGSGLKGAALLFADDRADNIQAAAARGWKTHLFTTPEGWAARLVAEGLLSAEDAA